MERIGKLRRVAIACALGMAVVLPIGTAAAESATVERAAAGALKADSAMASAAPGTLLPDLIFRSVPGPTWTIKERRGILWNVVQKCVRMVPTRSSAGSSEGGDGMQEKGARPGTFQADDASQPNACANVDRRAGYVVLKDISPLKPYSFLLLPTERVTGIEDSQLWVTDGPNYWRAAYENREYVQKVLKLPLRPTQIGFAANSIYGRSQDQLHIHMSCIRPDVAKMLADNIGSLSDRRWTPLPPLPGKPYGYRALLTDDATLARTDPVRLLAASVYPGGSMLPHALFMAAVTLPDGRPGFAFLDTQADSDVTRGAGGISSNWGASEELLDNTCAIAKEGAGAAGAAATSTKE